VADYPGPIFPLQCNPNESTGRLKLHGVVSTSNRPGFDRYQDRMGTQQPAIGASQDDKVPAPSSPTDFIAFRG
jgi:hypothetical protein